MKRTFLFLLTGLLWSRAALAQPAETPPVAPEAAPAPAPPADAPPAPPTRAQQMRRLSDQLATQRAELERQKAIIERLESFMTTPKQEKTVVQADTGFVDPLAEAPADGRETAEDPRKKLLIYGYVQGQFQTDNSSQNAISQDGKVLNQNKFSVPRARLIAEREWKIASLLLELDGNTLSGPNFAVQRAEATMLYRGKNPGGMPPLLAVTLGQFRVPFGSENLESSGVRYFMERSLVARAFFPSEIDLGVRVAGAIDWFRYSVAAMNGNPIGATFQLNDPDSAKDVVGRLGVETKPVPWVDVSAGVSALVGRGFHQESAGTKPSLQWSDRNGDGILQTGEIVAVDAVAARPSATFRRFGFAFDADAAFRTRIGETQLRAALYLGNNLDRGLYVSDPVLVGRDSRSLGYMLSVLQEVGDWVVVGGRTDFYNPDSDSSDYENAVPVQPNDRSIRTWSPIIGLRYRRRARLLFQYDIVRDKLGRDERGLPADLSNDRMTVRLQVNL